LLRETSGWTEMWIERMGRCAPVRHADGNVSSSFRQTAEEPFWLERQNCYETAAGKTRGSP
jgi:hypothetical protein